MQMRFMQIIFFRLTLALNAHRILLIAAQKPKSFLTRLHTEVQVLLKGRRK